MSPFRALLSVSDKSGLVDFARGGKGRSGMSTKDEDFVTRLFVANTHTPILFFSSRDLDDEIPF